MDSALIVGSVVTSCVFLSICYVVKKCRNGKESDTPPLYDDILFFRRGRKMDGVTILLVIAAVFTVLMFFAHVRRKMGRCEDQETSRVMIARRVRGQRSPHHVQLTNQDDDIWNISSRVNQQGSDTNNSNWPTHPDHRIDMQSFAPEYTIKDNRPAPPPYSEVDLPSYEQATGCPPPRADLTPVHHNSENRNVAGPSR